MKLASDPNWRELAYRTGPWRVTETSASQSRLPQSAAVFSVGNGFIGIRGCFEEGHDGRASHADPPVYLNGVYEIVPIHYHESAFGFPTSSDTRVPVPDGTGLEIIADGDRFLLRNGQVVNYSRSLDLRNGLLTRRVKLKWPSGRIIDVTFERVAFFAHPRLAAIRIVIVPINFGGEIDLISSLQRFRPDRAAPLPADSAYDPRIGPRLEHEPWVEQACIDQPSLQGYVQRTRHRGIEVSALMAHQIDGRPVDQVTVEPDRICRHLRFRAGEGEPISVTKYLAYACDDATAEGGGERSLALGQAALDVAAERGFEALLAEQTEYVDRFWEAAAIDLGGAPVLETATRFGLFQLLQAAGRDGQTSISAKGQTGEGYEGHVFWDAESFVLPCFAFTAPEIARSMLVYRHAGLAAARDHARTMGHRRGALFPWRTIGGSECSSYFPAGSAQYHINADIAHAVALYFQTTDDLDFLARFGAEILIETARLWLEVGYFDPRRQGHFCINRVTGPDEYSALVDNNFYTNAMARDNLENALEALDCLARRRPQQHARLLQELAVSEDETRAWREAAARVYLPYCEETGIYLQDEAFLGKKPWDFDNTPAETYPLLLHYHPLAIYRHQVCKQADVVLATFLLGHRLDPQAVARTYEYYKQVTVHDSTLSPGIFSVVASAVGNHGDAFDFFKHTVLIDLDNLKQNSAHGLHMAALATGWMAVVHGFGGLRTGNGELSFDPTYVDQIGPYRFRLRYRARLLEVSVGRDSASYRLLGGEPLELVHQRQRFVLKSVEELPLG